jgi:hypothetical protein
MPHWNPFYHAGGPTNYRPVWYTWTLTYMLVEHSIGIHDEEATIRQTIGQRIVKYRLLPWCLVFFIFFQFDVAWGRNSPIFETCQHDGWRLTPSSLLLLCRLCLGTYCAWCRFGEINLLWKGPFENTKPERPTLSHLPYSPRKTGCRV